MAGKQLRVALVTAPSRLNVHESCCHIYCHVFCARSGRLDSFVHYRFHGLTNIENSQAWRLRPPKRTKLSTPPSTNSRSPPTNTPALKRSLLRTPGKTRPHPLRPPQPQLNPIPPSQILPHQHPSHQAITAVATVLTGQPSPPHRPTPKLLHEKTKDPRRVLQQRAG